MGILGLKKVNCKNCHKCIRECPVKSIDFTNDQANIIDHECILCGRCVVACPQNAKNVKDDTGLVLEAIAAGKKVVASVAPSFIADFDVDGIKTFEKTLQALGFAYACETAEGAYIVKKEYERMVNGAQQDVIITTCCHSAVKLVQKYFPSLVGCLAPALSPMQAHGRLIKQRDPDAFVVFIGPCISKKEEIIAYPGDVDVVLTFEELRGMMDQKQIDWAQPGDDVATERYRSRFFPTTGGILQSMDQEGTDYRYMAIDGAENCIAAFKEIAAGNLHHYFIEMSVCEGSCIAGDGRAHV